MQRRRLNIQNFGSGWLRPPGITKTLHQLREEKREQEEHQEAMRREQLAQELAEAEAGNMEEEGGMDDVQLDGAQDLDEEIPDADADADFALGGSDTEEEEEDDLDEDEERSEDSDSDGRREERQNDLMAARMRMTDDAYRQALARGDPDGDDMYGGAEELAEEDNGHILDEEDFAGEGSGYLLDDGEGYEDLGMDADLDDDVPEAESGMYEHTDSEAELESSRVLSSDDEDRDVEAEEEVEEEEEHHGNDIGFAPRAAPLGPPQSPTLMSRNRRITNISTGRPSLDINTLLSQDESSFMDSSPIQNRRARQG